MLSLFTILRRRVRQTGLEPGQVMLTFDDGPNEKDNVTKDVLNVLHDHRVKAGFCLVGKLLKKQTRLAQRIYHSGHTIINHTYTHTHPLRQNFAEMISEMQCCEEAIADAVADCNYRSAWFRSPFGIVTPTVRKAQRAMQMKPVLLTHYAWDTRIGPEHSGRVIEPMIASAHRRDGGLFVFHDGDMCSSSTDKNGEVTNADDRSWVPEAVDRVIRTLKKDGFRFVCLPNKVTQSARAARAA